MKICNVLAWLGLVTTAVVGGTHPEVASDRFPDHDFSLRELLPEEQQALALLRRNLRSGTGGGLGLEEDWINFERRVQVRDQVSLAEIVAQVYIVQQFEAYLAYSLQIPTISGPGPSTLLIPWDRPFQGLDAGLVAKLQNRLNWGAHLQNLIRYHIILDQDLETESLPDRSTVTTASGEEVVIDRIPGTRRV